LDLKGRKTDSGEKCIIMNFMACIPHRTLLVYVTRMGEGGSVYRILVGTPEGKRPLGRSRRRWEDNIKLGLRKIRIDGPNWIQMA
jgi:hypothetical protein